MATSWNLINILLLLKITSVKKGANGKNIVTGNLTNKGKTSSFFSLLKFQLKTVSNFRIWDKFTMIEKWDIL